MNTSIRITTRAQSMADVLGYRGQKAGADAVAENSDYRIIGGHMIRLLLHTYPTAAAIPRSTVDADAALDSLEVVGSLTQNLLAQGFTKHGGNLFYREMTPDRRIEINVLAPRTGTSRGIKPQTVAGVGQVDTLPELSFALQHPAIVLDVEADLGGGETITYQTRVPTVEAAVVLKAHGWRGRSSVKDIADLHTLLEIREAHPDISWRLHEDDPIGFRKDTVKILQQLRNTIVRKRPPFTVPVTLDKLRFAGLITRHIAQLT